MTAAHGSLKSLRSGNRNQLLHLLRESGALHRAELARLSGLSRSTVSGIVAELLAEGLVVEATGPSRNPNPGKVGRPGTVISLNPDSGLALGIDFSAGQVRVALASVAHEILADAQEELDARRPSRERLDAGASLVERIVEEKGLDLKRVLGVGLGLPDPVDLISGTVGSTGRPPNWVGVRAADELGKRLGLPVAMDNTAHLASLAEVMWGAGVGARNVLYLKLSAGVGAGFLLDGRIFRGAIGAAGEIGHVSIDQHGEVCPCGNRGCLELYASVPAILSALQSTQRDPLTLARAIELAELGDRASRRVFGDVGELLGHALTGVCNLLNLERIIVGGDLVAAGDYLLQPLRETIERLALPIASSCVRVVPAELGDMAGAYGGVALVLRESQRLMDGSGRGPAVSASTRETSA